MNYKEAVDYIEGIGMFVSKPGLERIGLILEKLGNPQKKLKFVHIAGTNGKGSAAAMTASVLKACGYKTGLFTSPYLFRFNERMQINGQQIPDETLAEAVSAVKPVCDGLEERATAFEVMTACGMKYFADEGCDIVVLEVGLGGRFDATNIIDMPEAAVIMNIGLDHTKILGDTVEQIAFEKAGIIKPGCDCVIYEQQPSVKAVFENICAERGARLHSADFSRLSSEFDSLEGQAFTYKGVAYALPLLGAHQLKNAAVVLETAEVLRSRGWKLDSADVEHGLYSVSWPARFEVVCDDPCFVVDGGHNPQCAETVAANLRAYFPDTRRILLTGVLADKDYAGMFDILAPEIDEFVCVTPASPRAVPAYELGKELKKYGKPVTVCDSVSDGVGAALDLAREQDAMVCAAGSLYMVGDIRACFNLY